MANFKKLLMVVPPNITFDNFVNPSKNTKSWIHKNGKELGVIVTDVPLGAMTICTWLQSQFDIETRLLDFNVEIHKNWDHPHAQSFEPWFEETIAGLDFEPDLRLDLRPTGLLESSRWCHVIASYGRCTRFWKFTFH